MSTDLSQIDLDAGSESTPMGGDESESQVTEAVEYVPATPKKKGLDLYYSQRLKAKTGTLGLLILASLTITFSLMFLLLAFSYTPKGIAFLRSFELRIFW